MNNSGKQYFRKHFLKIQIEAILNSALCGLIVGLFSGFAVALVTWLTALKGLWLSVGVMAGVSVIAAFAFYFIRFRPTVMRSARRIDSVGLEERLITMVEYENDPSPIADIQRQDAKRALNALSTAAIYFRVATGTIICLAVAFVLCAGMTTVTTLADHGLLPGGDEIIEGLLPEERIIYVSVTYETEDGGEIKGEADQLIPLGTRTEIIEAIPDEGYEFFEWDDGYDKPVRYEKNVQEDKIFIAIFMPIGDSEDQNGQPSDQDKPQGKPQKTQQDGKPQDSENKDEGDKPKPDDKETDKPMDVGGGKYEEVNQIINGEIYYKEVLDEYKELLRERLETEGANLSQEERAIIESYLGIV